MSVSKSENRVQSLVIVSPKLYRYITTELEHLYHIHSYDVQIGAIKKKDGIQVIVRFGKHFSKKEEQFFLHEQVKELSKEVKEFVESTGEACKKALIDDYFKMMAP
ncbi:hypothetical protein GMD78_06295 [Ornithinibacillus sp. L9]|uniref:Uncharacterized protein n=1 Tax=Ornithinibacillus caprae TaxID=2678566 RepID=A0A6N8FL37_9BACI|nr:hypothetical protein [Ornithinibacillus caprae]MUK88008.1 hypothetical protein [Ornithinibacillus caprae]